MPRNCVAFGCHNHSLKQDKKRFFELPKRHLQPERRDRWLNAIHRVNEDGSRYSPVKSRTLCSDHFITGKPSGDPLHPDYVPSVFPHQSRFGKRPQLKGDSLSLGRYERCKAKDQNVKKQCVKKLLQTDTDNAESCDQFDSHQEDCVVSSETLKENCDPKTLQAENDSFKTQVAELTEEIERLKRRDHGHIEEKRRLNVELAFSKQERDVAQAEAKRLRARFDSARLSASMIDQNPSKSMFFTGLPHDVFNKTFGFLSTFLQGFCTNKDSLSFRDQFFLTLVRLRLDLSFELISILSGCGESTVRDYFWKWLDIMFSKLSFLVRWPDRESIIQTLPPEFKQKFPRLTCIIDCFEIFIEQPKHPLARGQTYSNYKSHCTIKCLIGCTPLGAICFLSPVYGGRVSDIEIVRQSGFISSKYHHPGDQILADRGFTLQESFATMCSAELIIPAFTKGKTQLSPQEVESSRGMSSIRIHVERVIGLAKNRYSILQGTLPVPMIKSLKDESVQAQHSSIDRLLFVCASLVNLGESIVKKV